MGMNTWIDTKIKYQSMLDEILPDISDNHISGIYLWYRIDEYGINYGYIGQSVDIYDRSIQHLMGYDSHIDLSIRKYRII